jgi:hypothetical protein
VVFVSTTSGDEQLYEIVTQCRPPPHQDWGRAEAAGSLFAREDN